MSRALPTKENLVGRRFGKLEVIGRSEKRGSRGARTVPLWECRCECGAICYKATDTLTNPELSMCNDCVGKYATEKMREKAGFVDGTQISRIKSDKPIATNTSGVRGVYYDKKTKKWRARLKFKGKLMNFGTYENFDDAVKARKRAEEEYYGEFLQQMIK
ncbi:MAG: AP2 domain-containing protein [Ruminococcaceae bacterium]|nr:AP2 domain-containing protein [Oscillospiraceae bacterium]